MRLSFYIVAVELLLIPFIATAQILEDTMVLKPVQVTGFFSDRPYLRMPASVSITDSANLELYNGSSPIASVNQVSGVRMEERSPGSYRLSIRGSLIRSPFGIRNVKIYIDEYPLTDAGGNTYLNLIDLSTVRRIEILKGPDGSLYGANSGGVVKIGINAGVQNKMKAETSLLGGSYGLLYQRAVVGFQLTTHRLSITQAFQTFGGYRENSSMKRNFFKLTDQWEYNKKAQLRMLLLYSRLEYDTPGGLTYDQWQLNPRSARPPTNYLPGALEQNAGVKNNTLYGGIVHDMKISPNLKHLVAVFGTLTDFTNRFITNYEERNEKSLGIRSYFEANNNRQGLINLTYNLGFEAQQSFADVINYGNRAGLKDTIQAADDLIARQNFVFARVSADFFNDIILEASASINFNSYLFRKTLSTDRFDQQKRFRPQIMPRFTASFLVLPTLAWRATISKGYSPPTFNEVRSSDNEINTDLEPEWGYNYETGFRFISKNQMFWIEATTFVYHLKQAIVRRSNETGTEYFANSGDIIQPGIESQLKYNIISRQKVKHRGFTKLEILQISGGYTLHAFKFNNYQTDTNNFSGNNLTGVPHNQTIISLLAKTSGGVYGFISHTYTSEIPLNDANSVYAPSSNVIYLKTGLRIETKLLKLNIFCGVDNLLNIKYSLGYDINAFGGRYYNPAPLRNYFAGLSIIFN